MFVKPLVCATEKQDINANHLRHEYKNTEEKISTRTDLRPDISPETRLPEKKIPQGGDTTALPCDPSQTHSSTNPTRHLGATLIGAQAHRYRYYLSPKDPSCLRAPHASCFDVPRAPGLGIHTALSPPAPSALLGCNPVYRELLAWGQLNVPTELRSRIESVIMKY